MKKWLIYCHINNINNKRYIGLTHYCDDPNKRWRNGKGYLNNHHKVFATAILKYGGLATWETAWTHIILEQDIDSLEVANEHERYWISYYHTYVGDDACQGYNATIGGDGSPGRIMPEEEKQYRRQLRLGKPLSTETKQKMSLVRKGKPQHMTQKKLDQIDAMHTVWKGQHHTEETVNKIRAASIGRVHSDETKQKISETKKLNPNHAARKGSGVKKPVKCIETGEIFLSITEASIKYNISKSSIMGCAKGHRRSAGGFH